MEIKRPATTRWATASERWEYTWTQVEIDPENGRPVEASGVAGIALSQTPEGKESSTWTPFSVTQTPTSALVWWRRRVISLPGEE